MSALVTLFFSWSPDKNSTTTFLQLKGNKAFSQAERLFPSDNSLSQLKCRRETWRFTASGDSRLLQLSAGHGLKHPRLPPSPGKPAPVDGENKPTRAERKQGPRAITDGHSDGPQQFHPNDMLWN